jgi:hypothetical protein
VSGINETIRFLRKYERDLFLALRKELVLEAQPILTHVAGAFPSTTLSNWHTSGGRVGKAKLPPYGGNNLKAKAGTGATRGRGVPVLRIEQKDAGRAAFDSAGSKSASRFVSNLDKKHSSTTSRIGKSRSRALFRAVKMDEPTIEMAMRRIVARLDIETTKRMTAGGGFNTASKPDSRGGGLNVAMNLSKYAIGK